MKLYPIPLVAEGRLSIASCPVAARLDEDVATLIELFENLPKGGFA